MSRPVSRFLLKQELARFSTKKQFQIRVRVCVLYTTGFIACSYCIFSIISATKQH